MKFTVVYTSDALEKIDRYADYYESKQENLGVKFTDTILESGFQIAETPFIYPSKYGNTREKFVGRFPFMIIYTIEGRNIFIQKIFSCKTNPKKKYKKLKK